MKPTAKAGTASPSRRPRYRVVYGFLIVLGFMGLAPLGVSAYKLIDISRESLVTSQQEVQLQLAASAVRQLNSAIDGMRAQMTRLADSVAAVSRATSGGRPGVSSRPLLEKSLGPDFLLIRYTPADDDYVEVTREGFRPTAEVKAALGDSVRAARAGVSEVSDPMPSGPTGPAMVIMTVPMGDGRTASGTLTAAIDFSSLWNPVTGGRRAGYTLYAIDRQGRLCASQDDEGLLQRTDYSSYGVVQEFKGTRGYSALTTEFTLSVDGRPVEYIASFDTTNQGWGIFVQLEKSLAYAAVSQMIQATMVWAGAAMLLALILAYVLSATVTRPINVLAQGTAAFARGEFGHRVQVTSRNELGSLAETFNAMAEQIQSYIQRLSAAAQLNNELFMGTIKALAEAIDEKDPYTRGHSERVNGYAVLLAKQLGLSRTEIRQVHISSLFHDIGKIGIEDKILRKPAVLTDEEYTIMKQHPEKGAQMLSKIKAMKDIIPGLRFHHERWDGSGYPLRLKAEQIPMAARIVAVADAFDAMTTNRPYQKAMSFDKAIARLDELADKAFDRRVVSAFSEAYKAGAFKEPQAIVAEEQ